MRAHRTTSIHDRDVQISLGSAEYDRGAFGSTLLTSLRREGDLTPIIVLTARDDERSKVEALDLRADDYVTKPFGVPELLARTRSARRRGVQVRGAPPIVRTGDLEIDWPGERSSKPETN